jgi:hypothetical protein
MRTRSLQVAPPQMRLENRLYTTGKKSTGKYGEKSKGESHVTSGDVTSGQVC